VASKDLRLGSAIYSLVIKTKYCYGLGSCNLLYAWGIGYAVLLTSLSSSIYNYGRENQGVVLFYQCR
jgi:hypothetical protein